MISVSVIIPCYNYGHFLSESLESVIAQSFSDWECIIVDDGSSDNTKEIAEKYCKADSRIKYIYQENRGLSSARNNGIENAKGKFIQLLDADDLIEEKKLEVHSNFLIENEKVDIVYGGMKRFLSKNPEILFFTNLKNDYYWMPEISGPGNIVINYLIENNIMVVSSPLIRSQVFSTIGGFNERLKSAEDWEYWIRCAINNKSFHYLSKKGTRALIRSHDDSMMKKKTKMYDNTIKMRRGIAGLLNDKSLLIKNKYYQNELYGEKGIYLIKQKKIFRGLSNISKIRNKRFYYYMYHGLFWSKKSLFSR